MMPEDIEEDFEELISMGQIRWVNDVPTIIDGDFVEFSKVWRIIGNTVLAFPARKDGGCVISSRRKNDSVSIGVIHDVIHLADTAIDTRYCCGKSYNKLFSVVLKRVLADENHGATMFDMDLMVSRFLPNTHIEHIKNSILSTIGDDIYGNLVSIDINAIRCDTDLYGDRLGVGDSPMEEKLFFDFPPNLQGLVELQFPVGKYRLDFAFPCKKIAIEVDGKAYHSSFEQVKNDYERDAYIKKFGWTIFRFSGSEVYNDSQHIVNKVADLLK